MAEFPTDDRPPFDAPLDDKREYLAELLGSPVSAAGPEQLESPTRVDLPGQAATNAAGERKSQAGKQNWIPTGPRNVGGRIRALVVDPRNANVLYAGAASGGVHKSIDGGETWFPLWHEQRSLAIGALAICAPADAQPVRIWAATGEVNHVDGVGIFRSDNDGADWQATGAVQATAFEAIAAHPTRRTTAVAVGPAGIFRTTNNGDTWRVFAAKVYYSDVAYSVDGAGNPILYLVRAVSTAGEATVVRIDNPDVADGPFGAAVNLPANASAVIAAPGAMPADPPARGKIAICRSQPDVAFVRFTTKAGVRPNGRNARGRHAGVFRSQNARAAPIANVAWTQLPEHADWDSENQGDYNLSIGVNPADPNHLATGMAGFHLSRNANAAAAATVSFDRAMAWELYSIDRAQHADHHVALFARQADGAPAGTPELWVANDGGISRSNDWHRATAPYDAVSHLPLPRGVVTWRKRSHGIVAAQLYSLAQSPLVPGIYGAGLQDNGVWITTGGQTWHWVLDGDGASVAFDPDDPFTLVANWQESIHEIVFPGRAQARLPVPGDDISETAWPRPLRQGFLPTDGGVFGGAAVQHPLHGERVLHARQNRLYGTRRLGGDHWDPLPVGRGIDLLYESGGLRSELEVLPGPVARRLGLPPQIAIAETTAELFAQPQRAVARVRTLLPGPYSLVAGEQLQLRLNSAAAPVPIQMAARHGIADLASVSAMQLVAFLQAEIAARGAPAAGLSAQPTFFPEPTMVEITTTAVGPNTRITLGGNALDPVPPRTLGRLFVQPGAYRGEPDRPATVTLVADGRSVVPLPNGDARKLTIAIGAGGANREIEFTVPRFSNVSWIRADELAVAIREALGSDPATVVPMRSLKALRLRLTPAAAAGAQVAVAGTAVARLNVTAPAPGLAIWRKLKPSADNITVFDLSAAPALAMTIGDGTNATPPLTFTASPDVDPVTFSAVTVDELRRIIARHLAKTPAVNVRCDLELEPAPGNVTAIAYAQERPDIVWAGAQDGTLYRSDDDGGTWRTIVEPRLLRLARSVGAIAIDPRDVDRVYVGLKGFGTGFADPGFLFRTTNGGRSWDHIGGDVKDGDGVLLGVNGLAIDPDDRDVLYAATNAGVFRSGNGGSGWSPFNEGLPNANMNAIAFVPATRTLRVGSWGRGTFERHVGDRPAKDVQLFVRANLLDDGSGRPAPRGPSATSSVVASEPPAQSPDIKVSRVRPPGIGPDELIDGVEFDEDIAHEEPTPGNSNVFVQVHNRGSFEATGVRITALWADAANGPPPLPDDFWTRYRSGAALPDPLGQWHPIGNVTLAPDGRGHERVVVGYPRVHHFEIAWPDALDDLRRIGILLLVSCPTDPLDEAELDVARLLARQPKVAYRETRTMPAVFDRALFLRRTTSAQFSITAPAAPGVSALAVLGLTAGGPVDEAFGAAPAAGFVLPPTGPGTNPAVAFSVTQTVTLTLQPDEFPRPAAAQARDVIGFLNRELRRRGILVRARPRRIGAPPQATFSLRPSPGATLTLPAGAPFGLPAGAVAAGANANATATQPFNLTAGAPIVLRFDVTSVASVDFQPGPASARDVRETLNRALAAAGLPIEAVAPRVDLWVRRSVSDLGDAPTRIAGHRLADLVAEPAAVAAGAAREALFAVPRVYGNDTVRAGVDNFLYLRCTNLGDAPQDDVRHQLYELDLTAKPISLTAIAGTPLARIGAGQSAIVEFTWRPNPAAATGDRLFVLAVADHDSNDRRVTLPQASTIEEQDAFCEAHTSVAYREFTAEA
jgi:hypothetical protein